MMKSHDGREEKGKVEKRIVENVANKKHHMHTRTWNMRIHTHRHTRTRAHTHTHTHSDQRTHTSTHRRCFGFQD